LKLRASDKLLLACLASALAPLGVASVLLATQGWTLPGLGLDLVLILASAAIVAVAAAAWARGAAKTPPAAQLSPAPTVIPQAEGWSQAAVDLASATDRAALCPTAFGSRFGRRL
jgi:hypothetical protein